MEANRKEKITLGVKRENIGEEIVRLKKNIDLQLGLPQNDESTKSFLQVYKDTAACFDGLIRDCKRWNGESILRQSYVLFCCESIS